MLTMPRSSEQRRANRWASTQATITACKQTLLGQESFSDEGYLPAEYLVTFSYQADGQDFDGSYRVNSPQDIGHTFEILYNPSNPRQNSGSDSLANPWRKWSARIIGIAAALLAIWLWGRKDWF